MSQFRTLTTIFLLLISSTANSQYPQQVATARPISRMPLLYASEPDAELPGRFVSYTSSGCALSFARSAVRGLLWSGGCQGGRMQGQGTVLIVDYEKQPIAFYEGQIERGLRTQGAIYEFERKNGQFVGSRQPVVNSALQTPVDMPFLDMPRAFLLALDDWQRQMNGENFLASLGATWAPGYQAAATSGGRSPSTSGSQVGLLSPPSGRAALIALTPPGNVRSRNDCVKFEVLDAPIARAKSASTTLVDSDSFGTSRDGRRLNQKHLVAYNTCGEPLIITALSCSQIHMKDAGSNGRDSWSQGEFTGIFFTGEGVANVKDDVRLTVSRDYVFKQNYRNSDQEQATIAVYYGAWAAADIQTASGVTENYKSLSRKLAAVNRLANTVSGFPGGDSSQLAGGGRSASFPDSSWRRMGVQTCNAFRADEVWKSTP